MVAYKIAIRSIKKYKKKLIMIGILIALGSFMLVVGQSFVKTLNQKSEESLRQYYTGDLIIYSNKSKDSPSIFSFQSSMLNITSMDKIKEYLNQNEYVDSYVAFSKNFTTISEEELTLREDDEKDDKKNKSPASMLGSMVSLTAIEPGDYKKVFNNIDIVEGNFLEKPGLVLSKAQYEGIQERYVEDIQVGDELTLIGMSGASVNSLKVIIQGIYEPKAFKEQAEYLSYIDIGSYKTLFNYFGFKEESLPDEVQSFLNEDDEEAIFGMDDTTEIEFETLEAADDTGYTMVCVKLTDKTKANEIIQYINNNKDDLKVKAGSWKIAAGFAYQRTNTMQILLYVLLIILFITVGIIMMNTLVVNIMERVYEIGTMRAIGGQRKFIKNIFRIETIVLTLISSISGIVLGLIVIGIFHIIGLSLPTTFSNVVYGGGKLYLSASFSTVISTIIIVLFVSWLAMLYPLHYSTKITPLKAMSDK